MSSGESLVHVCECFTMPPSEGGRVPFTHTTRNHTRDAHRLAWNNVRPPGAESFLAQLAHSMCLRSLELSWNSLGDKGAYILGKSLMTNVALTELHLAHNGIGIRGATVLVRIFHLLLLAHPLLGLSRETCQFPGCELPREMAWA